MQLSGAERQRSQVELQILARSHPSGLNGCPEVGQGSPCRRTRGKARGTSKNLPCATLFRQHFFKDQKYFMDLCTDAWASRIFVDQLIFMQQVALDPSALRDPHRMDSIVTNARAQAASGNDFLVGTDANPDALSASRLKHRLRVRFPAVQRGRSTTIRVDRPSIRPIMVNRPLWVGFQFDRNVSQRPA